MVKVRSQGYPGMGVPEEVVLGHVSVIVGTGTKVRETVTVKGT